MMCVRKVSSRCCIPLSGANKLSRKKEKEKISELSKNQPNMAEVFSHNKLMFSREVGCVNQNHNQHH
jgi:hypothetical protein